MALDRAVGRPCYLYFIYFLLIKSNKHTQIGGPAPSSPAPLRVSGFSTFRDIFQTFPKLFEINQLAKHHAGPTFWLDITAILPDHGVVES